MPHDVEVKAELVALREENAQLRAIIADMSEEIRQIAEELKKRLEKNIH